MHEGVCEGLLRATAAEREWLLCLPSFVLPCCIVCLMCLSSLPSLSCVVVLFGVGALLFFWPCARGSTGEVVSVSAALLRERSGHVMAAEAGVALLVGSLSICTSGGQAAFSFDPSCLRY